jgi:DNA-binding MarR family transcriptional regulator
MTKPNLIRDTIRRLLLEMPGITHGQIVEKTGLAKNTVTKHVRAIRAEWEAKP